LPPGAAQASSTRWPGIASSSSAARCAPASCTLTRPSSKPGTADTSVACSSTTGTRLYNTVWRHRLAGLQPNRITRIERSASNRVQLNFEIPLSELIVDFFDILKSRTKGYASLDYQFKEYRADDLVKLEILVNEEPVDALATIVHRDAAYHKGQRIITTLKDLIPRQLFVVPIQAYAAGRVISRANVKALRKDVLAKCYGGDISRKKKLLEKQKRGKRRMKMVGDVEIPQEAFLAVLRIEEE